MLQSLGRDVELVGSERSYRPARIAVHIGCRWLCHKFHQSLAFHLECHIGRHAQVAHIADTAVIVDTQHGHTRVV